MQVAHVIRGFKGQGFRIQSQISDMWMNLARARAILKKTSKKHHAYQIICFLG